jgi:hypothetical protein
LFEAEWFIDPGCESRSLSLSLSDVVDALGEVANVITSGSPC